VPTDVRESIEVARPPDEVAAFMFDPANDARWTGGVVESRPLTEGPLRAGAAVERTVRFAGRTFTYRYTVVASTPASVELEIENPFPMRVSYALEEAAGGTHVTIYARGDAGGFFRVAGPLLNAMVRRNIRRDLRALERCLEKP